MIPVHVELTLILAVVGADDDRGVVQNAGRRQRVKDLSYVRVRVSDACVVSVYPLFEIGFVAHLRWQPWKARAQIQVVGGRELTVAEELLVDEVLSDPSHPRLVHERVSEGHRGPIWSVRVPVVDVQEEVVLSGVLLQPWEHCTVDVFGYLETVLIGMLVDLVPSGVEVPRQVMLGEGSEGCGPVSGPA
jgi:hypothetical protein